MDKINFGQINNIVLALDYFSEQYGTSPENIELEKQFWTEYFKQYPNRKNQKNDLIDLYTDLYYDISENNDPNDQVALDNITEIINYVKSL